MAANVHPCSAVSASLSAKCETKQTSEETGRVAWWNAPLVKITQFGWTWRIMTERKNRPVDGKPRGPAQHLIAKHMYNCAQSCALTLGHLSRVVQMSFWVFYHQTVWLQSLPAHSTPTSLQSLVSSSSSRWPFLNWGQSAGNNYFLLSVVIICVWIKYSPVVSVSKPQSTFPEEHKHTITNRMSVESNAVISIHMRL